MWRSLLLAVALMAPSAAQAKWREASTDHFVIYSEESEGSLRKFANRLERFDGALRHLQGIPKKSLGPANRLTVYVVSDTGAVRRLAGAKDGFLAGFYIPRASGSIAIIPRDTGGSGKWDTDAEQVLLHEYAHHFLYQNSSAAFPAWLSEGYAELHSTAKFEDDGSVGIGLPALHRAHGLMDGNPLPIDRLLTYSDEKLTVEQREAIYGRGWLLTHYLSFEPARSGQLARYVKELNSGKTSLDAAAAAFGDLKTLGKELDAYLKRRRMSYRAVTAQAIEVGNIAIRTLGSGEDALMDLKIRSRRGVSREQALALLPQVRRAAAPFANDAAVQATLAEAEYDAGYFKEAEAAADRALAADPDLVDALIYKGRARMQLASGSDDSAAWKDVRKWFLEANRVDAEDPEPLMLFYESFLEQGVAPTANAVSALLYAHVLAPQDRNLRMQVVRQHLIDGKAREARAALGPIAFDPHAGEAGQVAAAIIAQIDGGNLSGALEAGTQPPDGEAADTAEP